MTEQVAGTAIVTGGGAGLGLETVRALAARGHFSDLVVTARDVARATAAVAGLETAGTAIHILPLDLAALATVRHFPAEYAARGLPAIGALICNAGVQIVDGTRLTTDGFEETFAVNVLGHFLLSKLLLPLMTADARLVFISSGTHDPSLKTGMPAPGYTSAADLAAGNGFGDADEKAKGRMRYTTSKLCDVYLAYEFAKRFPMGGGAGRSVVASAVDPGMMPGSGLARTYGPLSRFAWKYVLPRLGRFMKGTMTTEASGGHVARLVCESSFGQGSGTYFIGTALSPSSELSYNQFNAVDLWTTCAALAGIDP